MELDRQTCYRALKSHDARFDGRFFTGVKTTGIYCRPVCPARTPKLQNVNFYPCAAAAEEAGFRPCLRCRPEASPGTPAWLGTSATVSRAVRLIEDGVMDEFGVEELARRLGVTPRHLRRLFDEHLGASPIAVAQSRRVLFAKKLISETSLPLTDIAFAAGYSSVRRFNAAFKRTYRMAPRDIRRTHRNGASTNGHAGLTLKLAFRPPFDWDWISGFLGARAIPGVEEVVDGRYRRTVCIDGSAGVIEVSHDPERRHLLLRVPPEISTGLPMIVERVRRIFDLRADPATIASQLGDDATMKPLLKRRPGLRVPGAWDGFEVAVRGVLGQQVSVKGARTLTARLVHKYGEPAPNDGNGLTHVFPSADRLSRARMSGLGITGRRIETIRHLAKGVESEELDFGGPSSLDEAVEALTALPGIGPWTANYVALRAHGEPDAFLAGDLGILKACEKATGRKHSEKDALARAEAWRPWRAYAAMHLWAGLDD